MCRLLSWSYLLVALLVLVFGATGGCESTGSNQGVTDRTGVTANSIESIRADYHARRYSQAFASARTMHGSSRGPMRERVAYLAGISAYQLGRPVDAKRYLEESGRSLDRKMAGQSWATIGLLHFDQNDYRQSASAFKMATQRLDGADKAEAAYRCAQAFQELGQASQARVQLQIARGATSDPEFRRKIDGQMQSNGYTLQVGAFSKRANADALVGQYHSSSQAARFGPPSVVRTTDTGGTTMYCVRMGRFHSFESASRARDYFEVPVFVRALTGAGRD